MTRFGWCLTAQHEKCIVTSVDGKRTCECTCPNHGTAPEPMPGPSNAMLEIMEKYFTK